MARVLIVEDDPYVRPALAAELGRRSHAVRTAGTALDGIREVSHHPPDVVVLDLGLPDLDGAQALKMIRAVTATPVIVATARDEETEIIRLLNDGADDYLVKPFSGSHLAARITALLRRTGPLKVPAPRHRRRRPGHRPGPAGGAARRTAPRPVAPRVRPARLPGRPARHGGIAR
jgi:DNA-binding response OmpR family regulator